jgi:type I restriction enzyme S subunit
MKRKEISTTENTERTEVDAVASGHSVANTEDLPDGFQMTELGPLPKEWRVVRLGEVALLERGLSWSKADEGSNGIGVLSIPDILTNGRLNPFPRVHLSKQVTSNKLLVKGDILLVGSSGSAENVGRSGILREEPTSPLAFASFTIRLRGKPDALLQEFAFYLIQSSWIDFAHFSKRAADGKYNLQLRQLQSAFIPIPPLPEQRAIAHVLRTVQRAKEATEGVIAALKELKKSLMQHLFTYGPVPVGAKNFSPQQESEIGPLPAHWRVVRLGEVVERPQYGYTASANQEKIGPKLLRITDIQDDTVYWPTVPFCYIERKNLEKYLLKRGDILVARIGATTGKTYLVNECPLSVFASYLIRLRTTSDLLPEYLYFFTHTSQYWAQINAVKGGRLKQGINIPVLTALLIPLPPLDEQREIARILQAVDAKIAAEQARRAALEELFKSLLHELMSGRIRVPHIVGGQRSRDSAPNADPLPESED